MILIFSLFIFFLILRLYLYADLKFLHLYFNHITVYSTVPFYATEIVITTSLIYVLYTSSQMERGQREQEHKSVE
jgi:hypothetical protein